MRWTIQCKNIYCTNNLLPGAVTTVTDYINNPVLQELIDKNDYNGVFRDERVYLSLRASAGYTSKEEKIEKMILK